MSESNPKNWQSSLQELQAKAKEFVSEEKLNELKAKATDSAEDLEAKAQEILNEMETKLAKIKGKALALS